MDRITNNIDKQIEFNKGKNLFHKDVDVFQFTDETIEIISNLDKTQNTEYLIDYATDKVLEEFYRINQYYSFSQKAKNDLRSIYSLLFSTLQDKSNLISDVAHNHYENLKNWINENNAFAEKLCPVEAPKVKPIICEEYSPQLQINILHIDIDHISEPVLDIGCGQKAHLIDYLTQLNIEAVGIDRYKFGKPNLLSTDWLEFDYGEKKWGTIVSNLGFSNHFHHHHLRKDGNYMGYAKTYMKILNSLKVGGSFYYAPDLPFIEKYLDKNQYEITKFEINNFDFKAVKIERLRH